MRSRTCLAVLLVLAFSSCEKGLGIINYIHTENNLNSSKFYAKVTAYNHLLDKVETGDLTSYELGALETPFFGTLNAQIMSRVLPSSSSSTFSPPIFGAYSQNIEDEADTDSNSFTIPEEETVTEVFLEIPFYSDYQRDENNLILLDGDRRLYQLDSIFGNKEASFKIKVQESNYYLGSIDKDNLPQNKKYYSDQDFSSQLGDVIADVDYKIDGREIITYKEDNPNTTDIDESKEVDANLSKSPRIRIKLDNDFFQRKIIDMEGSEQLSSTKDFIDYFRGINISTYNFSDKVLMLLDFRNAYIDIKYTYKSYTDNTVEDKEGSFRLLFNSASNIRSKTVNIFTYQRSSTFPDITSDNAKNIYLNASQFYTEIKLFDEAELQDLKSKEWIINEANLIFYINRELTDIQGDNVDPQSVYLYDLTNEAQPIIDYSLYVNTNLAFYSGTLVKKDGKGYYYKIRLTEHVTRILRGDLDNASLGLVITSNIRDASVVSAKEEGKEVLIPRASVMNPLGTVIYGTDSSVPEDKRLRLEIYHTEL